MHLQIETLGSDELLEVVNKQRKVLDLTEIAELASDTELDAGLSGTARSPEFNKESALRDLKALWVCSMRSGRPGVPSIRRRPGSKPVTGTLVRS